MTNSKFKRMKLSFLRHPSFMSVLVKKMMTKWNLGSYAFRVEVDAIQRPHYAYCMWNAAELAKKLGEPKISVLEFGVAGGKGLVDMEYHAERISKIFGVEIEIYGFDTGEGLPASKDYRDLAYHWKEGFFDMDVESLKSKLKNATLVMGNVETTAGDFFTKYNPAPIGAISFDVDYYSSTVAAFEIFKSDASNFLPRFFCYFDDTIGSNIELYNDFTGMRLAINEFNELSPQRKLAHPYNLITQKYAEVWNHQIWIGHFFDHKNYSTFISNEDQQLSL